MEWFGFLGFVLHKSLLQPCLVQQAAELRAYLKSKGAEISEENSEGGLHIDLAQIIEACDVCLKEDDKGLFFLMLTNHKKIFFSPFFDIFMYGVRGDSL
jgi:hypothetical protein